MILRLFFTSLLILCSFNLFATELGQLTPQQLETLQQQQNPLVIDIRTQKEWAQTGIIPKSHPLQFFDEQGHFNEEQWLENLKKLQEKSDQPIVLVCNSGNRSSKVGELLTQKLGMKNIYHLSKGFRHWLKSSHPVVENCHLTKTC
ncbi:MAG: rhodanese-like domain-containing protein [Methylococcales bacterium]|nr:rhodanese-like domain-containing protein [Methylococcales bacterium]